jgi:hypothetical protein
MRDGSDESDEGDEGMRSELVFADEAEFPGETSRALKPSTRIGFESAVRFSTRVTLVTFVTPVTRKGFTA